MAKNRFEQVDETQPDAITLSLWLDGDEKFGKVHCPAALTGGRVTVDLTTERGTAKDAFRHAISLANDLKAPIVVLDPAAIWDSEWGTLYRPVD